MYFGFLNVLKPPGMTSHDLVAFLRKLLNQKKIGHSGTLDPNAAGVMVVALGPATRLLEYLGEGRKGYIGLVRLGITTDTCDADGKVLSITEGTQVPWESLQIACESFLGWQNQRPPLVSAVRVSGKRLYEYARAGQEVEVPLRKVFIEALTLSPLEIKESYGYPDLVRLEVVCSKGTFVRSLARDLGARVGLGAHLAALLRTESDGYRIGESLTIEELRILHEAGELQNKVIPAHRALGLEALELSSEELDRVDHGNAIHRNLKASQGQLFSLVSRERLMAVARYTQIAPEQGELQPIKVMPND